MTLGAANSTRSTLEIDPLATESTASARGQRVPIVMPAEQEYYWRFTWQNEERQCLIELETPGQYVTFDSDDPDDAARWLREPDSE